MDTDRAYIGAAILIAIVVLSNLILYGMARSMSRNTKDADYMKSMQNVMHNSLKRQDTPLEELRKKVEELESKKKEDNP
jgi:hypothetical protein